MSHKYSNEKNACRYCIIQLAGTAGVARQDYLSYKSVKKYQFNRYNLKIVCESSDKTLLQMESPLF